jgi:deoxycytidine triphosphate deaminase
MSEGMSVIWVRSRVTDQVDDFGRYRKSDGSLLLTDARTIETFSVELTLGELYDDELSEARAIMYAVENDAVVLRPGYSVVVEVAERIRVPNNMFGLVMPKGHILLEQGILMASTKIEPCYDGKLRLLLFNTSRRRRKLMRGSVIASAIFFATEKTLEADNLTSREAVVPRRRGILKAVSDFVMADLRYFIMLLAVVLGSSVVAVIVQLLVG